MHPNDGRVVSNFIVQALRGMPITVYGEGTQTRSFCFVDDLIYGLIKLMGSSNDFTGPVNLGNPLEFTILELAELVIKLTHSTSDIIHKPLPSDDPLQRKPDIGLATSALNWKPQVELEQGLDKTIYYFRKILDIPI
jgi:UDP-glucuronate decarboxylase